MKTESRERNFKLDALNKTEGINSPRMKYIQPLPDILIEPKNAANKFYDKHLCQAYDKLK